MRKIQRKREKEEGNEKEQKVRKRNGSEGTRKRKVKEKGRQDNGKQKEINEKGTRKRKTWRKEAKMNKERGGGGAESERHRGPR